MGPTASATTVGRGGTAPRLSPGEVQAVLARLPKDEALVLLVSALIYEPVVVSRVLAALTRTGTRLSSGQAWNHARVKETVEALSKQKLLVYAEAKVSPAPGVADAAVEHGFASKSFEGAARGVEQEFVTPGAWAFSGPTYLGCLREARLGMYRGQSERAEQWFHAARARFPEEALSSPGYDHVPSEFRAELSELARIDLAFDAAAALGARLASLEALARELAESDTKPGTLWSTAVDLIQSQHELRRGHFDEALARAQAGQSVQHRLQEAWVECLRGNLAEGARLFDGALPLARGPLRGKKKQVLLPLEMGAYFVLALLGQDTAESRTRAERYLEGALSQKAGLGQWASAYAALHAVLVQQRAGRLFTSDDIFDVGRLPHHHQAALIVVLGAYFCGVASKCVPGIVAFLERVASEAERGGYVWYARQAEALTDAFAGRQVVGETSELCLPLLLTKKPEWEARLEALAALGVTKAPPPPSTTPEDAERLVWWVTVGPYRAGLEPRLQKKQKKGWTRGRPVALKHLMQDGELAPTLAERDKAVARHISVEVDRGYYGYGKETHSLRSGALRALVGHPLVFDADDPDKAVTVVAEDPALVVEEKKDSLFIFLTPDISQTHTDVRAVYDTARRLVVTVIDGNHRKLAELVGKGITVPASARERIFEVLGTLAPLVEVRSSVKGAERGAARVLAPDTTLRFRLKSKAEGLDVELVVTPLGAEGPALPPGLGTAVLLSHLQGEVRSTERDLEGEQRAMLRALEGCAALVGFESAEASWNLPDAETSLSALASLKEVEARGQAVLEWPEGKPIKLTPSVSFKNLRLRVGHDAGYYLAEAKLEIDAERVLELKALLSLLEASPSRFVRLGDSEFVELSQELRQRLDDLAALSLPKKHERGVLLPGLSLLGLSSLFEEAGELELDTAVTELLDRVRKASTKTVRVPKTLAAELRDYQKEGFTWLARLSEWAGGACLADDMGLGKTVQGLALLLLRAQGGPALIVAPASVCSNWLGEAERFAPVLGVELYVGAERASLLPDLGRRSVLVTTYDILHRDRDALSAIAWHTVVLDEAQAIKNDATHRAKAAFALKADFRLATTGTPIENHLGEIWSLFQFLNPGLLGSKDHFQKRFATPIQDRGDAAAKLRLRRLVRPFILRRTKSQVLEELPPRTEILLKVELSDKERHLYEACRQRAVDMLAGGDLADPTSRVRILAELMRLRRVCANPRLVMPDSDAPSAKLDAFCELVSELIDNGHRALVFSQFVDHLALIRAELDTQGVTYQYLDGSTPLKQRKESVDAFQAGSGDLFLISLKAGGLGLNLTAADYVLHLDPWWNPAVEDQASDRAHRIGQTRPVTVYRLVAKDTIEERILSLHGEKRDLASSLLEGTESAARLSNEEIMNLLRE